MKLVEKIATIIFATVLTEIAASGLAWLEQLPSRSAQGEIQFKPHFIMPANSANR